MAVTSQLGPNPTLGEVWIDEWKMAGLSKPSAIKPVFATLEQAMVVRRLGKISNEDQVNLKSAIAKIFA